MKRLKFGLMIGGILVVGLVRAESYSPKTPTATGSNVYGTALSNWSLTSEDEEKIGAWEWKDSTEIPTVGNKGYEAVFTLTDTNNYELADGKGTATVVVTVTKASYTPTTPTATGSNAYGATLISWSLTSEDDENIGVWEWKDGTEIPTVSNKGYEAVFMLIDTNNYELADGKGTATVVVTVTKASYTPKTPTATGSNAYGTALSSWSLTSEDDEKIGAWEWKDSTEIPTVGNDGYEAVFTLTDTNNYELAGGEGTATVVVTVIQTYGITIATTISHGTVIPDITLVEAGTTITLAIESAEGYELENIGYYETGTTNNPIEIENKEGVYSFTMPAYDVTVTATFVKTQATLDVEAVAAAKAAIINEEADYTVAQATANSIEEITEWLVKKINKLIKKTTGIKVKAKNIEIDEDTFSAASNGENGAFDFVVTLTKGNATDTAGTKDNIIIATLVYSVTIYNDIQNGSVVADKTANVIEDETIILTITPDEGYELNVISAYRTNVQATSVLLSGSGSTRTFTMPAYDVTVTATFKKTQATLDIEAIAAAKAAIENESYTVAQAIANTEVAVKNWLVTQINSLIASTSITVSADNITISNFTAASGSQAGSFDFTVSLVKGSKSDTAVKNGNTISATPVYTVSIGTFANGSVSAYKTEYAAGEIITLTISPDVGYELDKITAFQTNKEETNVMIDEEDGIYTFMMPAHNVTVTATFKKTQATLDAEAVATAKAAINEESYTVEETTANTETEIKSWLTTKINNLIDSTEITVSADSITLSNFEAAFKGLDGSFDFSVSLSKGNAQDKASNSGIIIADCKPPYKICIKRKGAAPNYSNILICSDALGSQYTWGWRFGGTDECPKSEYNGYHYRYFEFPDSIINNPKEYKCFVDITYTNGCLTRIYYPTVECDDDDGALRISKITPYPNPTQNHLSITLANDIQGSFTVLFLNPFGQTVFSEQYAGYRNNEVLSVDFNLPAGIYLLAVKTQDEILTSKIVIE